MADLMQDGGQAPSELRNGGIRVTAGGRPKVRPRLVGALNTGSDLSLMMAQLPGRNQVRQPTAGCSMMRIIGRPHAAGILAPR